MVAYDEIRITTRREISICRAAILKLEGVIRGFERKYPSAGADLLNDAGLSAGIEAGDIARWRDSALALDRWKERLKEHLRIMAM